MDRVGRLAAVLSMIVLGMVCGKQNLKRSVGFVTGAP